MRYIQDDEWQCITCKQIIKIVNDNERACCYCGGQEFVKPYDPDIKLNSITRKVLFHGNELDYEDK